MAELLVIWIPGLFLLVVLAGAGWAAIGVSAASPGWGSIAGFFGLFIVGGAIASYLPLRALRAVLEWTGVAGVEFWELPPGLRPGVVLIWAGLDQGVQLVLLAVALQVSAWPRRTGLRAAVALGAGSIFCRTLLEFFSHGAQAVAPLELATSMSVAGSAALFLGSLFGVGRTLAAWLMATLALVLGTWAIQVLPMAAAPLAGVVLLFAADRLLWNWRVGESEGVERLYPLWRAAYEVHRQCLGARLLWSLWPHISWRERVFRGLGNWLPVILALALVAALVTLALLFFSGTSVDFLRILLGIAGAGLAAVGGLGLAWAGAGWHSACFPKWAFLAGGAPAEPPERWRQRVVSALCLAVLGLAAGFSGAA